MENKITSCSSRLLEWYYNKNKRTFPWRQSRDPYQILIAEVMLQRTRAEQVVPVFRSFLQRFPSPQVLSKARLSEIENYFSKLGLLWRAKTVKSLSRSLSKDFNGTIPRQRSQLMLLPGVGEYVAKAVMCFAFGERVAVVDSNVCRVIGRVFGLKTSGEPRRNRIYNEIAERLVPDRKCREYNWAIIDHASTVCIPRKPKCSICSLNDICDYYLHAVSA